MRALKLPVLVVLLAVLSSGCTVKVPTIAHTHIGHATTAWRDTPSKSGLLIVAEEKAQSALTHAQLAVVHGNSIDEVKAEVSKVLAATNPQRTESGVIKVEPPFGLKQALVGAVDHISFAANSDDSTENIKSFATQFAKNSAAVLDRCDLIEVLGEDIQSSSSADEAKILTQELSALADANLNGIDSNGDSITGSTPEEFGVMQLLTSLESALEREDPPYTTVNQWYLFNLIQLPTGEWKFGEPLSGGGNGGGGY